MKDPVYLRRVRALPCCACPEMRGIQAHHSTSGRGIGQKASDHDAMPLCVACHNAFHAGKGMFRDWDRMRRREWQAEMVRRTRELLTAVQTPAKVQDKESADDK
jgi:hypothetical protein